MAQRKLLKRRNQFSFDSIDYAQDEDSKWTSQHIIYLTQLTTLPKLSEHILGY